MLEQRMTNTEDPQQDLVDLAVENFKQDDLSFLAEEFFKYKNQRLKAMEYSKDEYSLKEGIKDQIAEKYAFNMVKRFYFDIK